MPSRCRTSKDTPRKLAGRMKRRWRVVLFGLTCEIAHQIDLFVGERPHLLAVMRAHAGTRVSHGAGIASGCGSKKTIGLVGLEI
jgi:hypothetical protein